MRIFRKPQPIFKEEPPSRKIRWSKLIYLTLLGTFLVFLGIWFWTKLYYMEAPALVQYREFLVQSTEPGRVAEMRVKIGDPVTPQTVVAILDITRRGMDQWSPDMIFRTQDSIQKILADEAVVTKEIALKKKVVANVGRERQRARNLVDQGVLRYSEYKKLDLDHQTLQTELGGLQARGRALQGERQVLETIYQEHLQPAGRQFAELKPVIRGIVIKREKEPGEVVLPSQPVLTLIDPTSLYVKAYFPEKFQGDIHLGSKAVVILPDGSRVDGEVQKLYPASEPLPPEYQKYYMTRQRAIVAEIILKTSPAAELPYGMTVKARIIKPLDAWW